MVDATETSRLAAMLMFFSWIVAKKDVKDGPTKKRELRMIRANLENIPLRSLVVFSQGTLTFRKLDVMIHLMNGQYGKAVTRLLRRKKRKMVRFGSSDEIRELPCSFEIAGPQRVHQLIDIGDDW